MCRAICGITWLPRAAKPKERNRTARTWDGTGNAAFQSQPRRLVQSQSLAASTNLMTESTLLRVASVTRRMPCSLQGSFQSHNRRSKNMMTMERAQSNERRLTFSRDPLFVVLNGNRKQNHLKPVGKNGKLVCSPQTASESAKCCFSDRRQKPRIREPPNEQPPSFFPPELFQVSFRCGHRAG